jgi:hypothetical protein
VKTIILAAVLALGGCALTPEQRVVHMLKTYGPACQKLGFEADSDANRNCMMNMDSKQQAEDARIAAIIGNMNAGIQSAYQANQPPAYQPPRQTTCIPAGNGIRCY